MLISLDLSVLLGDTLAVQSARVNQQYVEKISNVVLSKWCKDDKTMQILMKMYNSVIVNDDLDFLLNTCWHSFGFQRMRRGAVYRFLGFFS